MASLINVHNEWNEEVERLAALQRERQKLASTVAAFDAEKPKGIGGKLGHAFDGMKKIRPLRNKITSLDQTIAQKVDVLRQRALDLHRQLGEQALAGLPNATLRKDYELFRSTSQNVSAALATIDFATTKCKNAANWEWRDMVEKHDKGAGLISYAGTRDAVRVLQEAAQMITNLGGQVKETGKALQEAGSIINSDNNYDFNLDMVGNETGGDLMSYLNMTKLGAAVDKLNDVAIKLRRLQAETENGRVNILGYAISMERQRDPFLDLFVRALEGYLPQNVAQGMRMKPKAPAR
jgi:hypothetical protein